MSESFGDQHPAGTLTERFAQETRANGIECVAFLRAHESSVEEKAEVLLWDQRTRWASGRGFSVNEYFAALPEVANDRRIRTRLMAEELRLRQIHEFGGDDVLDATVLFPSLSPEETRTVDTLAHSPRLPEDADPADEPGLTGTVAGKYEVKELLGSGGFGSVYRAFDTELRRSVAFKTPTIDFQRESQKVRETFLHEARMLAQLEHAGIVPVYESGRLGAAGCFIAARFLDGPTLAERIQCGAYPPMAAATQALRIAEALQYAHDQDIIHRDLKPANVVYESADSEQPILIDFGIAISAADGREGFRVAGTPQYMSPQQLRGEIANGQSDLYALGVVLHEMLTQKPPAGPTSAQCDLDPALWENLPARLLAICRRALAESPDERFASMAEIAAELRSYLSAEQTRIATEQQTRIHRRRWRTAIAALAVLAVLGFAWFRSHQAARARAERIDHLLAVPTADVLPALRAMGGLDPATRTDLQAIARDPGAQDRSRLHARLALCRDDGEFTDVLIEQLSDANPDQVVAIAGVLTSNSVSTLHTRLLAAGVSVAERLRIATGLAQLTIDPKLWDEQLDNVAEWLTRAENDPGPWARRLRPLNGLLGPRLHARLSTEKRPQRRARLATVLSELHFDSAELIRCSLAVDAAALPMFHRRLADQPEALATYREIADAPLAGASEAEKDRSARKIANAAGMLALFGESPPWKRLAARRDNRVRSELIAALVAAKPDPVVWAGQLHPHNDPDVLMAIVLMLGELPTATLANSMAAELGARFQELFREHPDAGVHSACEWALRRWRLEVPEVFCAGRDHANGRWPVWITGTNGHTFAVIPGPVTFVMGSPDTEAHRKPDETAHSEHIDHSYAIGVHEVTAAQFAASQEAWTEPDRFGLPAGGIDLARALCYCRWLSELEGLPEREMCYAPVAEIMAGNREPRPDFLHRRGYRLPTEAEWEYACRAGTITARPYGNAPALLPRYAVADEQEAAVVGARRPNRFGLFDMLGNHREWCAGFYGDYGVDQSVLRQTPKTIRQIPVRGGIYATPWRALRSAQRSQTLPGRQAYNGFRIARTVHPAPTAND